MNTPATFLNSLGLPGPAYTPGIAQAPIPRHPTARKTHLLREARLPMERGDEAMTQRAGAVVGGLAAALCQLDHFLRQLQGLGLMRGSVKQRLNRLVQESDEILAAAQKTFDFADADSINGLSDVLGQHAELLLQLKVPQIEAALHHINNMAQSNLVYVPVTTK